MVEGRVPPDEVERIALHFTNCAACRELMSSLLNATPNEDTQLARMLQLNSDKTTMAPSSAEHSIANDLDLLGPGSLVDDYRVERLLGEGGMGRVYLARDRKLGRRVALKVIRAARAEDRSLTKRFLFEARTTARFNHPNIVGIHAVGEHQSLPYVALEYVDGETLRTVLQRGKPTLGEALRIGRDITGALVEAHRNGILHRDLKPTNILLGDDGRVRVLDFGLAKALEGEHAVPPLTASFEVPLGIDGNLDFTQVGGVIRGTPAYMAPEQWRGEKATAAMDIYALGLTLAEMIDGTHPYRRLTPEVVETKIRVGNPPTLSLESEEIPDELKSIIEACLARKPRARPRSAEVFQAIKHAGWQLGLLSETQNGTQEDSGKSRRQLLYAAVVAVVGGGLTSALLARYWNRQEGDRPPVAVPPVPMVRDARPIADLKPRPLDSQVPSKDVNAPETKQPPPAKRKAFGRLRVVTIFDGQPQWANVRLDGKAVGKTPIIGLRVKAGKHRIKVSKTGFKRQSRRIRIQPGKTTTVVFKLQR